MYRSQKNPIPRDESWNRKMCTQTTLWALSALQQTDKEMNIARFFNNGSNNVCVRK